ncbi:MAG: hypothetical protein R2697_08435 [Ilumatobacteraceae bacterium]
MMASTRHGRAFRYADLANQLRSAGFEALRLIELTASRWWLSDPLALEWTATMTDTPTPRLIDTLVDAWYVVTMNDARHHPPFDRHRRRRHRRCRQDRRPRAPLPCEATRWRPVRGGSRMVNTHIHITGEPLTRGYVPDDTLFEENVFIG